MTNFAVVFFNCMVGLSLFECHSEQKLYSIGFKVILSNISNVKIPLKHYMLEFSL